MATGTKSPGLASTSPRSFLNSSMGMKLSDFSPAFTTTKLESRRTTSAVITSPTRISLRDRLSSNIAAKLSLGAAAAGTTLDISDSLYRHKRAGLVGQRPPACRLAATLGLAKPIEHAFGGLGGGERRRIQPTSIRAWLERRYAAGRIAFIPLAQIL